MKNLLKIKKYLIRQHFIDPKLKDPELLIKRFKTLAFNDVLRDLNLSRSEYLNALRMTVKGKYTVFHERKPANLHINAYNPALLILNGSNMDMTWISGKNFIFRWSWVYVLISDAFATIAYILGYLTKVHILIQKCNFQKNYLGWDSNVGRSTCDWQKCFTE